MLRKALLTGFGIIMFGFPLFTSADVLSDLQATIQALQAQIEQLKGGKVLGASTMCPNLYRNLQRGMRGNDVSQLQQFLTTQYGNFTSEYITGYFGPTTEKAVKQWQCEHKIVCSGSSWSTGYGAVGPTTRRIIAQTCSTSNTTPTVPTIPITSTQPATPATPTTPSTSTVPTTPVTPTAPIQPTNPTQPTNPPAPPTTALSTTPLIKLWLHHEWNQSVDTIPQLPSTYAALMRAAYTPTYSVAALPQVIKSQYVLTAVSYGSGANTPSPSVLNFETPGFDKDELMFLHASDPANLFITSGNERVALTWRPDERSGSTAAAQYAVYRYIAPGSVDTQSLNWWSSLSWQKITTIPATSYQDTDLSCQEGKLCTPIGTTVCYRVQSMTTGGVEENYSIPTCHSYQGWHDRQTLWWDGADVYKTASAPRGDTYANNTYRIDVAFNQASGNALQRVDVYAYRFPSARDGCGANGSTQVNQCVTGFMQFDSASLQGSTLNAATAGDFNTSLTISAVQPIIQIAGNTSSGKNITADPVFRVKMTDTNGNEYWYPQDGYMTVHTNNRIIDRFWTGYNMNPANTSWQNALTSYQNTMAGLGYNAMYLDEWRPLKSVDRGGLQNEAPAIEYPYPTGSGLTAYLQNSSPSDKWVQAIGQLANKLRANQPNMKLIGNTIKRWVGEAVGYTGLIRQAVNLLDGAVEEECIAGAGGIHTGAQWLSDLSVMEEYSQSGKMVVCLTRSNSLHATASGTVDDGIVPERRMYILASWLLINDSNKQMYLAPGEINTDWIKYSPTYQYPQINIFPEYFVPLGAPVGSRTQVGSLWKRDYANGVVYVNPGTSAGSFTLSNSMKKVSLIGGINQPYTSAGSCEAYPSGKCEENPGRVEFVDSPAGQYSVPPGQAMIFVK